MLEGLNTVKWSKLHHSHGGIANDVPDLIRDLLAEDVHARDIAFQKLHYDIWHDGRIWEVTCYEIPFLWELLKFPSTPNRLLIVNLITVIAREEGWYLEIINSEIRKQIWQETLSKQGKNLEEEITKARIYCNKVHAEIAREFSLLYPYLFCKEPLIRDYVAKAFEKYPEFKTETLPLLEKALITEQDELARISIENSIEILSQVK